jgi:hypothetical protein
MIDLAKFSSFDTETSKFSPGRLAPPIVCASASRVVDGKSVGQLFVGRDAAIRAFLDAVDRGDTIATAYGAYDLCVLAQEDSSLLPIIFRLLDNGRVHCILAAETLNAIYYGTVGKDSNGDELRDPVTGEVKYRYSLEIVTHLLFGRVDAKQNDWWRGSYELLRGVPEEKWPPRAKVYPVDDANNTLDDAAAQILGVPGRHEWVEVPGMAGGPPPLTLCRHCHRELTFSWPGPDDRCASAPRTPHRNLENLSKQVDADFCLRLGAAHGFRTDPEKVETLSKEVEEKHEVAVKRFQKKGWIREDGTEDQAAVKRDIALAYGAKGVCKRCGGGCECRRCGGTGKAVGGHCKACAGVGRHVGFVQNMEIVDCRGEKVRGRYRGCAGIACLTCLGKGKLSKPGSIVTCKTVLDEELLAKGVSPSKAVVERGCDGTGLDVDSAIMLPRTKKLGVSTDRDTAMESGDDDISDYGENEFEKSRTTYVPYLRKGISAPLLITPNVLVATGRCSYEGCPVHQFPRSGGERGCIRARGAWCGYPEEMVLGSTDYSAGELCTLAQLTFWLFRYSRMMEAINRSGDPGILHSELAAEVLGLSLDEFLRRLKAKDKQAVDFRQASKPENFGKPAGMGSPKIVYTNRKKNAGFTVCERGPAVNAKGEPGYWGIRFCVLIGGAKECGIRKILEWKKRPCPPVCEKCVEVEANILSPAYFKRFPEIKDYHKWAARMCDDKKPAPSVVWDPQACRPRIIRERGDCDFPAFCNNGFQGMLADIGKDAYCEITRECYLGIRRDGSPSPLAGCRVPLFLHDEPLSELFLRTAHLSGPRIAEIMMASGSKIAPDVVWKAETALAFWWSKSMESKYEDEEFVDGLEQRRRRKRLVPWGPIPDYLKRAA